MGQNSRRRRSPNAVGTIGIHPQRRQGRALTGQVHGAPRFRGSTLLGEHDWYGENGPTACTGTAAHEKTRLVRGGFSGRTCLNLLGLGVAPRRTRLTNKFGPLVGG